MFTAYEIMLIRAGLALRLEKLRSPALYQEHKDLLHKLWELRDELSKPRSEQCPIIKH